MDLNSLSKRVHLANAKWWQDINTGEPIKRNKGELLALIHSEISECYEGEVAFKMDDKLPQYPMAVVETIDSIIRIFDYLAGFHGETDINGVLGYLSIKRGSAESLAGLSVAAGKIIPYSDYSLAKYVVICDCHMLVSQALECERKNIQHDSIPDTCKAIEPLLTCVMLQLAYMSHYYKNINPDEIFEAKMAYNAAREDHKHEARRIAGGKQF